MRLDEECVERLTTRRLAEIGLEEARRRSLPSEAHLGGLRDRYPALTGTATSPAFVLVTGRECWAGLEPR